MPKATGEFHVESWNEDAYEDRSEWGKLTRASVAMDFTGDIDGEGSAEWLMCYKGDGTARFVGLQRIEATLDGRIGGFVVESIGEFDGKRAVGKWSVIPGSASDELDGMSGSGSFEAPLGSTATFELEYGWSPD